jgi:hypothetical protein
MEDFMVRFLMCLLLVLAAGVVEAAPRGRRYTNTTPPEPQRVYGYTSQSPHAGHTGSAQGVAEMMASRGVMQHFGGNSGYEGVGMGSTPEQALGNCCYSRSGMAVVDQGVARGRDGRYYACKRYGR